ncbi:MULTISPECIES: heat-inducible transcriptional repressor HrcA [Gardnerella]|uniref:Heat-inducible transcription repressor HrcA n=1 Tax=Gardnerella pickettii JCP8017A TaxID=1261062 RepID=T2PLA0_9BIFI|nr:MULTISPECIES: heat-inducible transcriptional repressor HrcA [Gardnerella]MDK7189093.1 heat-inducible transcriptional repressor HrcA [Bifidobacterium sp. UMB1230]EPI52673.1 transcription repressor HrcA [Gardnerella pickettii JCP8017A]EPI55915.1 transcription repressor HrcA [Gardnerella pickettii JCP7659]EPI61924.1 transcription repressor HrcA [Gardnerella pickettii JCP8017B]RDX00385.1 HrcA family transcriptional regulator [Gardnerella vaginalis]
MMILRAVVEDYIRSHEPVGSASLAKNHKLGVSSATIRNDMSLLEEEGYLIQPHTSAGRIPTEKGYRYFVDGMAALIPLSNAQRRGIRTFLSGSVSLQDTLQRSARLLASITGQVALVASPALSKSKVKRIEIVQVSSSTLLVVVITDAGGVAQHIIQASNINPDDLLHLVNMVNESCVGASLLDASKRVYLLANRKDLASALQVISQLANALEDMHNGEHSHDLYMAGASQLAHRQNIGDFASLFDALEEQAVIMRLMTSLSEEANDCASGVSVAIGSETHTPGLLNASVVTSAYGYNSDSDSAFIGSIGPTHMDYAATMTAVKAVAKYLNTFISENS